MTILIPVLGDQLSPDLASLRGVDRSHALLLFAEVAGETGYVRHHQKKIALIFAAMRHFADERRAEGWRVDYVRFDDPANTQSLSGEVARAAARHGIQKIRVVEAGEWRVQAMLEAWSSALGLAVEIVADDRFLCSRADFGDWARPRKRLVMEDFYRLMRKQTGLLMRFGQPEGDRWNYDAENRKRPPRGVTYPPPARFEPDPITRDVLDLVAARFGDHFGELEPFGYAVTRAQALTALEHFITHALPGFGDFQDAIVEGEDTMYHAILSPYINCGLLLPGEVAQAAADAYAKGLAPLNAVEGFIRQIIGWREYIRGIYWHFGPDYAQSNALGATRPLPAFFWTGETDLRCVAQAVDVTRREAYAHHIQRLMVLGLFALLIGVRPAEIEAWFLVVYADAYEWVELPNVHGMSQFADGGILGSKPYAASGAYIDRMSDHCERCRYDVKLKTGPDACPFNALYWDFIARHATLLRGNQRISRAVYSWEAMAPAKQLETRASAAAFLGSLPGSAPGWAVAEDGAPG